MGQVLLRCEEGGHPQDVAGGCLCASTILDPCDEERPVHLTDRRQCLFSCNAKDGRVTRLRCPDGATPTKDVRGCGCGGDRVLSPCANGAAPKSVDLEGKVCVVTCS